MPPKTINDLIGEHPTDGSFFNKWLSAEEITIPTTNVEKRHRCLTENDGERDDAALVLEQYIIDHHITEELIEELKEVRGEIYEKYGIEEYKNYVNSQEYLTQFDTTAQVGNFAEIVLIEYVNSMEEFEYLNFKLRYNPNTSQSMKGDDLLMFNKGDIEKNILIGESKFRSDSASQSEVEKILKGFRGAGRNPISISFIASLVRVKNPTLSKQLSYLNYEMKNNKIPILHLGFLLSDGTAKSAVQNHSFLVDYKLNDKVIEELEKGGFPVDLIEPLKGRTFGTFTSLTDAVKKILKVGKLSTKNRAILKTHCTHSTFENFSMISLCVDNPKNLVENSFTKAKEKLYSPETLTTKTL